MSLPQPLYAMVIKSEKVTSAGAGAFVKLELRTHAGWWKANIWDYDAKKQYPQKGNLVKLNKFKDQTESKHENIVLQVNDIEYIVLEQIPEEYRDEVVKIPKATEEQLKKAWNVLTYPKFYDDENNFAFVQKCFDKYKDKILTYPAATHIHHEYQGGWAVHVAEVVKHARSMSQSVKNFYNFVDNDVIMVSAALHDIGKLETYFIDEIGFAGKHLIEDTIGHLYYSIEIVKSTSLETNIPQDFIKEVCHCIAAHHGSTDFGSIKPVMSLEAFIVSTADNLSAKCGIVSNKLKELKDNPTDEEIIKFKSEKFIMTNKFKQYLESKNEN